jgi:hypothetical protein
MKKFDITTLIAIICLLTAEWAYLDGIKWLYLSSIGACIILFMLYLMFNDHRK